MNVRPLVIFLSNWLPRGWSWEKVWKALKAPGVVLISAGLISLFLWMTGVPDPWSGIPFTIGMGIVTLWVSIWCVAWAAGAVKEMWQGMPMARDNDMSSMGVPCMTVPKPPGRIRMFFSRLWFTWKEWWA